MCGNPETPESLIYHPPELIEECWYHMVETPGQDEDCNIRHYGPFASKPVAIAHQKAIMSME